MKKLKYDEEHAFCYHFLNERNNKTVNIVSVFHDMNLNCESYQKADEVFPISITDFLLIQAT